MSDLPKDLNLVVQFIRGCSFMLVTHIAGRSPVRALQSHAAYAAIEQTVSLWQPRGRREGFAAGYACELTSLPNKQT